ncbi:MAG: glycosyltransferase family 2 protein [Chloroflexi bacterium]|nr:glycosyltransferase family 2 protein [Chloroflexota bacterium]MCY3937461.1 glycosyltransferase family 2 protein [Chloroflexota bacterium]
MNRESSARLSISMFFPLFNEEANVRSTATRAIAALEKLGCEFEVILVNDGSTDRTREIAEEIASSDTRVRCVSHPQNRGYGAALRTGFSSAKLDLVAFADGDGQFDPAEISLLLNAVDENDMVVGYRISRADAWHRTLNARAWSTLMGVLFGVWPKDLDCGFKLFRREVVQSLELESNGAFISTELLAKAKKAGFRIGQIGVNHYPRAVGTSTGANLLVIVKAFYELLVYWRRLR